MDFCDLKTQYQRLRAPMLSAIERVLDHGQYILGPEVTQLEASLAQRCHVDHCISCASGTDALMMVLMQLGVGPGDLVYTTPFTFVATAEPILLLGATPVFVDVQEDSMNLCPRALERELEKPRTGRAKAVIAVDLFGRPCDYPALRAITDKEGMTLVADGAQSMGATLNGRSTMALADVGTTSFYPAKPLGCYGDGGAVFCSDAARADELRSIRVHGRGRNKYDNVRIGINGRLDTIQAAILLEKLKSFDQELDRRREAADLYDRCLEPYAEFLRVPKRSPASQSAWAQYTVLCKSTAVRERLRAKLREREMPTVVYYPQPLHQAQAFAGLGYAREDFPVSVSLSERVLSLPMGPDCDLAAIETALSGLDLQALAA